MKNAFQNCVTLLVALTLASLWGCGSSGVNQVKVAGKVTLDGKPLKGGTIKFVARGGETPSGGGSIASDGTYVAQVPPGKKKVLIVSYKVVGQEPEYEGVPNSPMREKLVMVTHGIYNVAERTPLEAEVFDPQEDNIDFQLVSSPSK